MKLRIYIDTSVVGGFFDEEFKEPTQRLFKRLESNEVKFVISDLLELELIQAPKFVSELLLRYPGNNVIG
jgi:predicted nucleic acid-binding protein